MISRIFPVSFGQSTFFLPSARTITAGQLKRVVEAKRVKAEETGQGVAVFFRCFVYMMDSRLETITAVMTPQAYRRWRDVQSISRQAIRILPLPVG